MTAAPPPNCGFWNFGRQKCDKSSVPTIHFTNPPFSFRSHKKKFLERNSARAIMTPSDLTVSGRSSENLTVSAILDWFNNGGSEDGGINKCVIERFDKEAAEMYKRSFKLKGHPPGAINVEMYRLIREWTPWDIARRLGSAFFRIFSGTEENPEFIQSICSLMRSKALYSFTINILC
uniref:Uncharacterized protein n=1 Tax=Brassica oleracea var. oleracea TaxID=109376 RepID=A0A0D3AXH8_BRAOL